MVRRLSQAAAVVDARSSAVATLHAEIDRFIDLYNSVIDLLSRKFVQYDTQLTQWEAQVDAALLKHSAQLAGAPTKK